jgi:hypothetical protein
MKEKTGIWTIFTRVLFVVLWVLVCIYLYQDYVLKEAQIKYFNESRINLDFSLIDENTQKIG